MDTEERFEPNVFKRRAVSPSLSNSPKLAQSPPVGGNGGGKRLNFQGFSGMSFACSLGKYAADADRWIKIPTMAS